MIERLLSRSGQDKPENTETSNDEVIKVRQVVYRRMDPAVLRKKRIRKYMLWTIAGMIAYAIVVAYADRILFLFERDIVATSAVSAQPDTSNPAPLMSNSFKLGQGLTQLMYAGTNDQQYIKWRNRTFTHLVALGIDISVVHDAIEDLKLTLDETIVLRDQIQKKIKKIHGEPAASTFVVGVELIPVTRALERYLKDNGYRNKLAESNVSIFQLGSLLTSNINEAVFPDDIKIDLVAAITKPSPNDATQEKLYQIIKFREDILNYFYADNEDIRTSELLLSSS